jgi:hypothetical protein
VKLLYDFFSVVDVHDHYRQGTLNIEEYWKTTTWWHRILATLLGMIFTDAYLAYSMDYKAAHSGNVSMLKKMLCFEDFLGRLAHQMIFNTYLSQARSQQRQSPRPAHNCASAGKTSSNDKVYY